MSLNRVIFIYVPISPGLVVAFLFFSCLFSIISLILLLDLYNFIRSSYVVGIVAALLLILTVQLVHIGDKNVNRILPPPPTLSHSLSLSLSCLPKNLIVVYMCVHVNSEVSAHL